MVRRNADLALLATLALLTVVTLPGAWLVAEISSNDPPQNERRIVFVQGIDSSGNCEVDSKDKFRELWTGVASNEALDLYGKKAPYVFSYSGKLCPDGHGADYKGGDTCSSIDGGKGHSKRFGDWLETLLTSADNDGVKFDIVAHSMGGVVVLNWVSEYKGAPEQLKRVRAIVTLDSPLQGRPLDWVPKWLSPICRNGEAIADLRENSMTIIRINAPVSRNDCGSGVWADVNARAKIFTVGNTADIVVPATSACIAGPAKYAKEVKAECTGSGWREHFVRSNHDCVFRDDRVQKAINKWLESLVSNESAPDASEPASSAGGGAGGPPQAIGTNATSLSISSITSV